MSEIVYVVVDAETGDRLGEVFTSRAEAREFSNSLPIDTRVRRAKLTIFGS